MGSKIVKIIFTVLVIGALLVVAGAWMIWKRPLTVDARMSRMALSINGLEERELTTGSGEMTYWEGGAGPTMVLVHGAGDQAGAWARTIAVLVEKYRVVIPDMPGHWKSDPGKGPIHITQLLDGLDRLMDECCPKEPATIVGNSMGGWLGILYARDNPERVERLVMVNGAALLNPDPQVNIFPKTRDEARETMKGLMGPASPPIPGYVLDDIVRRSATGPAARFAQTAAEMGAYLLDGRLGEVTVPVELVWGDADQLLTIDYAQRILDGLPRARLHPIRGCGHVPHRECPLKFLDVLEGALAMEPPEPRPTADDGDPDLPGGDDRNEQAGSLLHKGPRTIDEQAESLLHDGLRTIDEQAESLVHDGLRTIDEQAESLVHDGSRTIDEQAGSLLHKGPRTTDEQAGSLVHDGSRTTDEQAGSLVHDGSRTTDKQAGSLVHDGSRTTDEQAGSLLHKGPRTIDEQAESLVHDGLRTIDEQAESLVHDGLRTIDEQAGSLVHNGSRTPDEQAESPVINGLRIIVAQASSLRVRSLTDAPGADGPTREPESEATS